MTIEEHVAHWLNAAERDEKPMEVLFETGSYIQAMFMGQMYIEKICKAVWVKNNDGKLPPRMDNFIKLLDGKDTGLTETDMSFLDTLIQYQSYGMDAEYDIALQEKTTKEFALNAGKNIKSIAIRVSHLAL